MLKSMLLSFKYISVVQNFRAYLTHPNPVLSPWTRKSLNSGRASLLINRTRSKAIINDAKRVPLNIEPLTSKVSIVPSTG